MIHRFALTAQTEQCQVLHQHDGTRRLVVERGCFLAYTLPVEVVHIVLHGEFLVEVVILIPETLYAIDERSQQHHLADAPLQGTLDLSLALAAIEQGEDDERTHGMPKEMRSRMVLPHLVENEVGKMREVARACVFQHARMTGILNGVKRYTM